MFLFSRGHVTGTHGTAVILAALAYADAAQGAFRKMSMVFREREVSFDGLRPITGAETQILVERVGVNLFARIHFPAGIPYPLELAEGFHQLRAKHFDEKLATRLSVAVLSRKRAAHRDYHVRSLFNKSAKILDALFCHQIKVNPHVNAGIAKVA